MTSLKEKAQTLRKQSTDTERFLWRQLRSRQLQGLKFRRQVAIGPYIVDFVCTEQRVIVECDGSQHRTAESYDQKRDEWLRQEGFLVLRFWNNEVLSNLEGVLTKIAEACKGHPHPSPLPSRERG